MTAYIWFATPVNNAGTATADSTSVTVWVGATNPTGFDIFIEDLNGDGLVSPAEWQNFTGGGLGLNGGSATVLFDGNPGGSGILYSGISHLAGATGLKAGLTNNFSPVSPENLDPAPPPCFLAGTLISVPNGPDVPVENLRNGDLVRLADGGSAPILWTGDRSISSEVLRARRKLRPVLIPAGVLDCVGASPCRNLIVSPQHRILLRSSIAYKRFGTAEVLVAAHRLVGAFGIRRLGVNRHVRYCHLLLPKHSLLWAEGVLVESLYPGPAIMRALPKGIHQSLGLHFESTARPVQARIFINGREADDLVTAHVAQGVALVDGAIPAIGTALC